MGGGKGPIDHYVTPVKAGRVIIEMGGKCEFVEVSHLFNYCLLVKYVRYTLFVCVCVWGGGGLAPVCVRACARVCVCVRGVSGCVCECIYTACFKSTFTTLKGYVHFLISGR
jgi:hypothetical protein